MKALAGTTSPSRRLGLFHNPFSLVPAGQMNRPRKKTRNTTARPSWVVGKLASPRRGIGQNIPSLFALTNPPLQHRKKKIELTNHTNSPISRPSCLLRPSSEPSISANRRDFEWFGSTSPDDIIVLSWRLLSLVGPFSAAVPTSCRQQQHRIATPHIQVEVVYLQLPTYTLRTRADVQKRESG